MLFKHRKLTILKPKLLEVFFYIYNLVSYLLIKFNFTLNFLYYDREFLDIIYRERKNHDLILTTTETLQLYECVKSSLGVEGDLAEVGVYKGGSALIISIGKADKKLYLFDTFKGIPSGGRIDGSLKKGDMTASIELVKNKLKNIPDIYIYSGVFPKSAKKLNNVRFSFVHLDVDIYKSTKDSLEFFYPLMNKGGIILVHDYPILPGVKKACNNFFKEKPENTIKMTGNQAMIIKL